ncbi:MAG TPA: ADP-forming succinate--CoA ligase subunit beta [Rhodobacter sp.]|mgnify:FL=1|jgi:malate-CoA ligase subunit beta|nr:malate--CoA ligase subunit beta [Pseudomonadota bacterium]MDO7708222.1 malate--CoA ligase subunit beta [Paracoccaceae bacterium]HCB52976.1 ADP-forming succinate--CoA ligase subunit beta [Rhodobacter sp.]MDA1042565.1 malate--CoA ligase subunit beta [Pseudomonadota bacterium]MDP5332057.1 malate--CoA ligase subunit beta [Paracoccaceae bacterium]|tara:strand:- start:281 stop:1477 length:1197 start_codon:yes stop_codon:yes gene_type:complete
MDIHEYQAKDILSSFGVNVPIGALAYSPEQAAYRAHEMGGACWVVKAQIHAGGRGKVGGVRLCHSDQDVYKATDALLGKKMVTHQTGPTGKGVYRIYVEAAVEKTREIYLGLVLDRSSQRVMILASPHGGKEIEEISERHPETIIRATVDPALGLRDFQTREIAFALGVDPNLMPQMMRTLKGCYRAFRDLDATMVEINPLAITADNRLVALDAKMSFDDNALFRHPQISELRDKSQEDTRETLASDRGISYVGLSGNIGCLVNGGGLAMATMDCIQSHGGQAANFLDIGGGATAERAAKALRLLIADPKVEAILINIFAGINRCDWVAEGLVQALSAQKCDLPIVVRFAGTNVQDGWKVLAKSGLPFLRANTLVEAASRVVLALRNDQALLSKKAQG